MRYLAGLLALGFGLTACSGAGGGSAHAVLPSAAHAGPAQTATIKITIPKAPTIPKASKKADYVSAATQSIAIAVYDSTHTTLQTTANQNLTSGSPGCTTPTPISPLTCAISIALTPGSYALDLTTYDGLLSGGVPSGNQLSSNLNFPVTIVAGQANSIPVSLGGIPASVVLSPSATAVLSGNNASGYSWGTTCPTGAQSVSVFGVDADGNYILGPGAPTVSLYAANTTAISVGPVGASAPNAFTVSCLGVVGSVNLVASAIPAAGTGASTLSSTIETTAGTTATHVIGGTFSEVPVNTQYFALAAGPDGNLWAVQNDGNIAQLTLAGAVTVYPETPGCIASPHIAAGPDGALWFAEFCSAWGIGRISTSGVITHYSDANTSPGVGQIVSGSDGALWFQSVGINGIGRITTAGVTSLYTSGFHAGIESMALGPDGAIWFTENFAAFGRISTSGVVTEYPPLSSVGFGIAAGPDGALWVCEANSHIARITTSGVVTLYSGLSVGAGPDQIVAGPDGALWFNERNYNNIGRITTSGVVTEYPESPTSSFQGIAIGPDGTLWFTEGASVLGHFQ